MNKIIILGLLAIFSTTPQTYAAVTYFPPLQPLAGQNNAGDLLSDMQASQIPVLRDGSNVAFPSGNYPRINEIEKSLYGRIFNGQDILLRLARIEKTLFSTTFPNSTLAQRVDNVIMNYNQINRSQNVSIKGLDKLEAKILGANYPQDTAQTRVERLEQTLLGAAQDGDLNTRVNTLQTAIKNTTPTQNYAQIPTTGKNGIVRNLLGALGGAFLGGGYMTGFTPPIDPFYSGSGYNGYNSYSGNGMHNSFTNLGGNMPAYGNSLYGYNNPTSGIYRGYRSNRGYSDQYSNYGTGSRVTILD